MEMVVTISVGRVLKWKKQEKGKIGLKENVSSGHFVLLIKTQ